MKERAKRIKTGLIIIVFVILGTVEYVQLMTSFDLPQVILFMPIIGALAVIFLKKLSFAVPILTAIFSIIYQIVAGDENALEYLYKSTGAIWSVILQVLPICLIMMILGMGGGALIRVMIAGKRKKVIRFACLVLGIIIVALPYGVLFKNPIYPIAVRVKYYSYVNKNVKDYAISSTKIYYNLQDSEYHCRVEMSDRVIRAFSFDENGDVQREN